jgi:hypothetical protein
MTVPFLRDDGWEDICPNAILSVSVDNLSGFTSPAKLLDNTLIIKYDVEQFKGKQKL